MQEMLRTLDRRMLVLVEGSNLGIGRRQGLLEIFRWDGSSRSLGHEALPKLEAELETRTVPGMLPGPSNSSSTRQKSIRARINPSSGRDLPWW